MSIFDITGDAFFCTIIARCNENRLPFFKTETSFPVEDPPTKTIFGFANVNISSSRLL